LKTQEIKVNFIWITQRAWPSFPSNNNNIQSLRNSLRKSYHSTHTRLFKALL